MLPYSSGRAAQKGKEELVSEHATFYTFDDKEESKNAA